MYGDDVFVQAESASTRARFPPASPPSSVTLDAFAAQFDNYFCQIFHANICQKVVILNSKKKFLL
jgi:hypothetical protein